MTRLALRGLRDRKARTAFTALAVILGVALISGTFILTDTISKSFDKLIAQSGESIDVRVIPKGKDNFDSTPVSMPATLVDKVQSVEGAEEVSGNYGEVTVALVDKTGKRVGPNTGAPTLAFSITPERFDAFDYEGRRPESDREVAVGRSAAEQGGLKIGDQLRVQGNGPIRSYEIVGLASWGGAGTLGGAGFVMLTLPEVQTLAQEPGRLTEILVDGKPDVSQTALKAEVIQAVGRDVVVRTGKEDEEQTSRDLGEILSYLTIGLLVFGVIALLVGAFVIFNTFTITVAQRTREFGMLRAIGASRKQVLRAVIAEALLIGIAGSVLGILAGLGLAPMLRGLLQTIGFELPSTGLVLAPRTIIAGLLVGTLVTLVSCLAPALRATRISPMEALREGAVGPAKRKRKSHVALEAAVAGLGVAIMLAGLLGGFDTSPALLMLGGGALLVFIGVGMLSPLLVAPLAAVIGRPLERVGGVAGKIARGNSVRSPGRTAGTAAALMVGVALVAFVSIFVSGLKASFSGAFEKAVTADFVVVDKSGLMPEGVADAAAGVQGVETTANLRVTRAKLGKEDISLAGMNPQTAPGVVDVDWKDGSDDRLRALGPAEAMVEEEFATEHKLRDGSPLKLADRQGKSVAVTVRGTFSDRGDLFGDVMLPDKTVRDEFGAKQVLAALIATQPDVPEADVRRNLGTMLDEQFPTLEAQTRDEFIDSQVGQINQIVYLFYALLALSVLIALFGIVNTLALSVYERTRELGLLRAVGTSRRQVRRIVRGEAIITAVMGALLGVVIGVLFGVVVTRPLEKEGFVLSLPVVTLVVLVFLGALAGILAAIAPARRASRIDVLRALTYE